MDVINELEKFLLTEITGEINREIEKIAPDEDLISQGIIDSLAILKLVAFIERQFGVKVGDEDIAPENFQTLTSIKAFVEKKRSI